MIDEQNFVYEVYGLIISSPFEIKELEPSKDAVPIDTQIVLTKLGLLVPNSELSYSFSKERQTIIVPVVGAFVIEGVNTVLVEPAEGVTEALLSVAVLGPVLAILLHLRRRFVLHGSAVIHDGRVFGFVGDKGAGKSTLAAMLLKNQSVDFYTDDLLVVSSELRALRGYPQMKLSDEALQHANRQIGRVRDAPHQEFPKNQFLLNQQAVSKSLPIGGIYELRRASRTKIEDLQLHDAIRVLLRFSYISRYENRIMSTGEKQHLFDVSTRLAASGAVSRLYVPENIAELDQVFEAITETAQG